MCRELGNDVYECDGSCNSGGTVWGTGLYTSDSDVFKAAKQMGLVPGKFQKIPVCGCSNYLGAHVNGISTSNYGNYPNSYILIPFR